MFKTDFTKAKGKFIPDRNETEKVDLYKTIPRVSVRLVKDGVVGYRYSAKTPNAVIEIIKKLVADLDKEVFGTICVDTQMSLLNVSIIHMGTLDECMVSSKDIFKTALLSNSKGIIAFHNHPSGSLEPSRQDCMVTDKLKQAGMLMDIDLIDHVIMNPDGDYYSFKEHDAFSVTVPHFADTAENVIL